MAQPTENRTQEGSSSVQAGDLANQLKSCREAAGLEIDKAAEHMHLSRHILETLEKEDFDNLPEAPYVRGYLRSYARLAERNPAPIIRTYELLRGADPDAIAKHYAPALAAHRAKPRVSGDALRLGILFLGILLLGVITLLPPVQNWAKTTWASFAYKTQQDNIQRAQGLPATKLEPEPVKPATPATQTASTQGTVTRPDTPSVATATVASDKPIAPTATLGAAATPSATNASATPAATPATPNTVVPAPTSTPSATASPTNPANPAVAGTASTAATTNPATTPTAVTTPANATTPTPVASNTPNADPNATGMAVTVKAEFTQEVWMQIRDAKGKRVLEVLGAPNTSKEITTTTPLTFKIGNAPGLKLFLNGQPYDLTPYTRGSVANFKVQ